MMPIRRGTFLAIAGPVLATAVLAQSPAPRATEPGRDSAPEFLPVPANVKAEGLPPIPASIVQDLAPYASSRRAMALDWHPTRREILITTAFDGNTFQIHSVAGPGMDRQQLTFFPTGNGLALNSVANNTVGASYAPDASYFVFNKDSSSGGETMQLFRFDPATKKTVLLTDGNRVTACQSGRTVQA